LPTKAPEALRAPSQNSTESSDSAGLESSLSHEISELLPENGGENPSDNTKASSKKDAKAKKDAAAAQYKEKVQRLKNANPPTALLVKQIKASVLAKLNELKGQEKKAVRSKKYAVYNETIAKMRLLRKLSSNLLYKTYEELKVIWLKLVHDIV